LVLASAAADDAPRSEGEGPSATEPEHALARLGRALRDAGHEVVHAGQGVTRAVVAAIATQEDVQVVVLLAPAAYDAGALARELGDEVVLVPVAPGERPAAVVERVAQALATA